MFHVEHIHPLSNRKGFKNMNYKIISKKYNNIFDLTFNRYVEKDDIKNSYILWTISNNQYNYDIIQYVYNETLEDVLKYNDFKLLKDVLK